MLVPWTLLLGQSRTYYVMLIWSVWRQGLMTVDVGALIKSGSREQGKRVVFLYEAIPRWYWQLTIHETETEICPEEWLVGTGTRWIFARVLYPCDQLTVNIFMPRQTSNKGNVQCLLMNGRSLRPAKRKKIFILQVILLVWAQQTTFSSLILTSMALY